MVEAPFFQALSNLRIFQTVKRNIGSSRKTLVLNALSKCSWRGFSDTNGRQVSDGAPHPIVRRSGPDTVGIFTFLTPSDFQSFAK